MIRDKIKSEEYFKNFIEEDKNRIKKFMDNIKTGSVREDRIPEILGEIDSSRLGITVAKYSAGFSLNEIKNDLLETIDNFTDAHDSYVELLWIVSMGVLLNIDDANFNKIVKIIDDIKLKDYVIDYIISYRQDDRKINNGVAFEKPYKRIMEITKMDKEEAEINLKEYLKKYWYNNHNSKYNTYFGYWSFESAAIVKIKKLENSIFKGPVRKFV